MYIELSQLSIQALAGLVIDANGFLQVTGLDLDADFTEAVLHFDNLVGGGDLGETINNILTAFAPTIWDLVRVIFLMIKTLNMIKCEKNQYRFL